MPDRLVVDLSADGQAKVLTWPDGGIPEPLSQAPLAWPLDADALEDLRWYLEDYLQAPFGVWEERGPAIREKLHGWGDLVFESVFGPGKARDVYQRARDRNLELVFRSADPGMLGLPWELMRDGAGPVAMRTGGISRTLPVADSAGTLDVPGGKLRVLMVISRPAGTRDVGYQMVARPLLERLDAVRGEVSLTVLRPPTFDALRDAVQQAAEVGEPFHVVHFDGHGVMPGRTAGGGSIAGRPMTMAGSAEGVLSFEKPGGGSDLIKASQVAQVLADGRVPVVVLNACQSGAVGKELEASVATALLKAGCAAVVAMAYTVYAVAAAEFMTAFYESLFAGESVGQAVTVGRKRLFEQDDRPSLKGDLPLADWLVPVHYLRREVRFPDARTARPAAAPSLDEALDQIRAVPSEAEAVQDPFAAVDGVFVGRDDLFYQLEAAARLQRVVVLTGPGGTGKTELAKGFARWWRDTGGVDDPRLVIWYSFEPGVATFGLEGVINGIGEALGLDLTRLLPPLRLKEIKRLLARYRTLLVWDNFESVMEMPNSAGVNAPLDDMARAALKRFLDWVHSRSRSSVLITSRTQETWLGEVRRIPIPGLSLTEAAQYTDHLLEPYPTAQRHRERRSFGDLLDWLDGHPLAMRLILPGLETTSPPELLSALRGTIPLPAAETPDSDRSTSLAASITYSYTHLSEQTRRLLPAVSLFHGVADEDILMLFSGDETVPARFTGISKDEWSAVLDDATRVGLLTGLGEGMYQIHPALPGYLAAGWQAEEPGGYDRERQASERALCAACATFSQWLIGQIASGDAALAYALIGLQRRTLGAMLGHALDHCAWGNVEDIVGALDRYWDTRGLAAEADVWADRILDAITGRGQVPTESTESLWLYVTTTQATRQKDAGQPDKAARTYRRALAYLHDQPATDWARGSIAVISHQLGMTAHALGRLDEAREWYHKSLAIKEALGNRRGMAITYHQLGITAQRWGRLDEAQERYRKCLTLEEELGDRPGMASTYNQLGNLAYLRSRLDEAQEWYDKSLVVNEALGDRRGMALSYHGLGMTALARGRLEEAQEWYRRSLAIEEAFGNRPGMARLYHQLSITAQVGGRLDEAEEWVRRSFAIKEELGDRHGMAFSYGQLGLLAEIRQQPRQALEWMVRCVALFDQFPHPSTGPGPAQLARLTRELGTPALEETWRQVTGQPLPGQVRDYITSHQDEDPGDSA